MFASNYIWTGKAAINPILPHIDDIEKGILNYKAAVKVELDKKRRINKVTRIYGYGDMDMAIN